MPMLDLSRETVLVFCGAFAGGLVNGVTGFGTGLTALPIWVNVLPPLLASPLTVICSVVGQVQTLPAIWHAIDPRRLAPFVLGGLLGVPLGVALLPHVEPIAFKMAVGILLVASCTFLLLKPTHAPWTHGGAAADSAIGIAGGILGGLAGLSGLLPTLWAELRGWEKDARRAVFQGYNLSILAFALVSQATRGFLTPELGRLLLFALPGTIAGAWMGRSVYRRLDTRVFSKLVLALLLAGGLGIVGAGLRRMAPMLAAIPFLRP
ncbi:MAG TPA: sulfite exporter TauE/SafE family protein [Usitatibacter sp.]|nr:sulfite exporter TauE/SafE family protein [Usitatibacter sp.]